MHWEHSNLFQQFTQINQMEFECSRQIYLSSYALFLSPILVGGVGKNTSFILRLLTGDFQYITLRLENNNDQGIYLFLEMSTHIQFTAVRQLIIFNNFMSINKVATRIKSAAFIRKRFWEEDRPQNRKRVSNIIATLPVSESRFISRVRQNNPEADKGSPITQYAASKTNPSTTSQIWRKVHSTRSEAKLKSLTKGREEEPVRVNLLQKVERIKGKHLQREVIFQLNKIRIERVAFQRIAYLKRMGQKGQIENKILKLLGPIERQLKLSEERYRARLVRSKKN